ncbi:D-alanine--D-alanine ligase family protein [Schleiferilactobacillus shenzhenensis]|uniref:D-alanine--D-alanine ligase n=1 Tax=Schleiferilactobacillus shenzhenensis LY-73 TaxID=1231336 RepID=U4TPC3_9LACO|nr:D-alanine--D-alanine ligase [Schleiferilactobacillus shenzhenensis]ERL65295.1 Ddl [Schleiferilactobacillus shenzhenensis LY-73]
MKIVVLAGGRSTERNVSLSSGAKVANALRSKGHSVALVDLFLGVDLAHAGAVESLFTTEPSQPNYNISDEILTDEAINALRTDGTRGLFGKDVMPVLAAADIVYMGLHGEDGENGKVQAVLDLSDIKYTGSGPLASGIAMDKKVSKEVMKYNGIPTADFIAVREAERRDFTLPFSYPIVVKPSNGGSSVGTHIVRQADELDAALDDAYRFDDEVVIEQFIKAREFSLGIVNGQAMPAIEIKVKDGWYDFKHKFQPGHTDFITPPDIPDDVHQAMQQMALRTFKVLGMANYGRIDFFWNADGLFVIEANSLPGMTPLSLLPQEAEAAGIGYADLCNAIVQGKWDLYQHQKR